MKRIFWMLLGAMIVSTVSAQELREGESAMVYYSPMTTLNVEFRYTVETDQRGIFSEFAEDLLGATEFVAENATRYRIDAVKIGTMSSTNYEKPHKVSAESGIPMLLHINERGLLTGYNVAPQEKKASKQSVYDSKPHRKDKMHRMKVAPYSEDVLKAANIEAQAYEAAKQIFHLREMRNYLLNGEVEHVPADGKAMELVLEELEAQEEALTALFVGKKEVSKQKKHIRIAPSDEAMKLYFSEENGFTNGDNIDADTIVVKMVCKKQNVIPAEEKNKKKKGSELSEIVYTIPGTCAVEVLYKGESMAKREVPVAQFGVDVALPMSWFRGEELPKIIFSEKTGNILSISK